MCDECYIEDLEADRNRLRQQRDELDHDIRTKLRAWVEDADGMDAFMEWLYPEQPMKWPNWVDPYR